MDTLRIKAAALIGFAALLAGCATRPQPVAVLAPAPVYAPAILPPGGASANLAIPVRRPDGSYPTPNQGLSAAANIWHLRVALNVAALGCRGAAEPLLVSTYNQWIRSRSTTLAAAERALIGEYAGATGDRAAYDGAMTRLYNYFAQPPAQPAFCAAAARVSREIAAVRPEALADYAAGAVPLLDAPFTDFYRAYDAYRVARDNPQLAANAQARSAIAISATTPAGKPPRLSVDPAVFKAR